MTRPRKCRFVSNRPGVNYFKPRGVPMQFLKEAVLPIEGYEALRLYEIMGLDQDAAARKMNVSRHTFGRILADARKTVAQAVVNGMALRIEGGDFEIKPENDAENTNETPGGDSPAASGKGTPEMSEEIIAVTSEGPGLDDLVDPRFGRAAGFIIMNHATGSHTFVDNGESQARSQGAGIQAAETVANTGAGVVLTGYVGPKAFDALTAAGIKVVQDLSGITVKEAISRYTEGGKKFAEGPNRQP